MMNALIASVATCYAGCNTGAAVPQSIHVLRCDVRSGEMRVAQSVKGLEGTTYFQPDADGKFLYTMANAADGAKDRSSAVRFPILPDGLLGEPERFAGIPAETPCHIRISPDGRRLAFASYVSGTVTAMDIDGSRVASYVFPDDACGPNRKRQNKAHAHFVFFTPPAAGRPSRLGAIDLGCDRIRFFDPETLEPDFGMEIKTDPGDGPRHAIWSPGGRFLYVVNELGSSVTSYAFDGSRFAKKCSVSILPEGFDRWEPDGETLATKASAIKATDDGRLILASNRGHDSIAFVSADPETGMLKLKNVAKLKGRFPRDFALVPGGKFLIAGHKMSDEIQMYSFDREKCSLEPAGEPLKCWRPLCFLFNGNGRSGGI